MPEMTRPLPRQDMVGLFDIVVVLLGELVSGQLSGDLTTHVTRRLARDGLLAEEASVGELGAMVADLVQRMRFALGEYATYPEPAPRRTTYVLRVPDSEAARACQDRLAAWGGSAPAVRKADDRDEWEVAHPSPISLPIPRTTRELSS